MSKVKAKAVQSVIRLVIKAGQAKPAPPVGPALGQAGLNLMAFCKDFNAKTADIKVLRIKRLSIIKGVSGFVVACLQARDVMFTSHASGRMPLRSAKQPVHHAGLIPFKPGLALQEDVPVPVSITAYTDKTFTYVRMALLPLTLHNHRVKLLAHNGQVAVKAFDLVSLLHPSESITLGSLLYSRS